VALLLDQPVVGLNIVRLMVIAPFFVMPTVSALDLGKSPEIRCRVVAWLSGCRLNRSIGSTMRRCWRSS